MKKLAMISLVTLMSWSALAQEPQPFKLTSNDLREAAADLEFEKENSKHSEETRRLMGKVALSLDEAADQNVDDTKPKNIFKRLGRTLGKGATWLSVQTMKPFMTAGSFATGFFEKEEKNQDVVALYRVFLSHSEEFDSLYKEAATPEEFASLLVLKFEEIVEQKSDIIMRDTLKTLFPEVKIPENIAELDWNQIDVSKLDQSKIDPKLINDHPEYQDLKPLLGEFTKESLLEVLATGYYEPTVDLENVKQAMPKIHELAGTLVGQIFGPKIVLGVISGTLAGLYSTPILLADIGAGVSVAVCMNKNTRERFSEDQDLQQFCSYATNWSSYQLMKSRAKGYVSGKKAKSRLKKWNRERLEKRRIRREQRQQKRELARSA